MPFDFSQSAYRDLREIALPDTHRLVVWCGAGLSRPANLPGWHELRCALDDRLRERASAAPPATRPSLERQANATKSQTNPWVAFLMYQRILGETIFRDTIRGSLSNQNTAPIPEAYLYLWRIRTAGMITLNLDNLATRAYTAEHPGRHLYPFTGNQIGPHTHVLKNPNVPFLCHLHGIESDTTSWVFTHDQLNALQNNEAYHVFVSSVLTSSTILFVGITATDVAVGSHLERLIKKQVDFGSHFWITHYNDANTIRWAEATAIRTIYYNADSGNHNELTQMLRGLASYIPAEDVSTGYPPASFVPSLTPVDSLAPPEEIRKLEPDEIRTSLNRRAIAILAADNPRRDEEYAAFISEYGYAIHNAWYTSTKPGENQLMGYTLQSHLNKGAFGQIFRAEDPNGNQVAIKILKDEIRTDAKLLHSFRRGVRAMRILSDNNVSGMVAYKEASEIPAFVVMDWIDGYDLREATEMSLLPTWDHKLSVALQIASILREAHSLPERVLHRDLRPANIMLKREGSLNRWQVFLLDFDLSWYLGSVEQSVVHGSDTFGYLAPEQIRHMDGASSRHPAVDSYGLGMTLFFVMSRSNPLPSQPQSEKWIADVTQAARQLGRSKWASIPNRFARLIVNMTHHRQALRWDLGQIVLELERMLYAERHSDKVTFADMLAEEVAARSTVLSRYLWEPDKQAATLSVPDAGLAIGLAGDDGRHRLEFHVARVRTTGDSRSKFRRLNEAGRQMAEILHSAGWKLEMSKSGNDRILITAYMSAEAVSADIDRVVRTINQVEVALPKM